MTVEQFTRAVGRIIANLEKTRQTETELLAGDALALIKNRVQNTGKDFREQKFPAYSTTQVPSYWYANRALNQSAKNKLKKKKTVSYREFRRFNGLPTNYTNLTFTGGMWRATGAEIRSSDRLRTVAEISGTNPRAARLLGFNSIRYGNVLRISEKEREILENANKQRVLKIIRGTIGQ